MYNPYTYFNALNSKGLNSLSSFVVVSPALFSCSRIFFSTPVVRIGIRLGVLTGESDGGGVILLNWLWVRNKRRYFMILNFQSWFGIVCQKVIFFYSEKHSLKFFSKFNFFFCVLVSNNFLNLLCTKQTTEFFFKNNGLVGQAFCYNSK